MHQYSSISTVQPAMPTDAPFVIVADTQRDHTDTLCELLRYSGFDAWTAYSGTEALSLLEGVKEPRVLICEIRLCDMPGAALVAKVRQRHPKIATVAVTSWVTPLRLKRAARDFDRVFAKPADPQVLIELVRVAAR